MPLRQLIPLSLLALGLLAQCGGVDDGDAGAADTGPSDGGSGPNLDAGDATPAIDAEPDAPHARDTGPTPDAGIQNPRWVPLPGLPDDCAVERAEHPERVVHLEWEPCPDVAEGCQRERATSVTTSRRVGWFDGDSGYIYVVTGTLERRQVALVDTAGEAVGAWREPVFESDGTTLCRVTLGVGEGHAAVLIKYSDFENRARDRNYVYRAAVGEIATEDTPLAELQLSPLSANFVQVSRELVVLDLGGVFVAVDNEGEWSGVLAGATEGSHQSPSVVGGDILFEDWAALTRIAHSTLGEASTLLRDADPGDVRGFHADEEGMAWLQGYDRAPDEDYSRIELWAAPLATRSDDLEPRLVTELPRRGPSAFGGGWYAMALGEPRRLEVVSLTDGTRRVWLPAEGGGVATPLYVSDHEILVPSGDDERGFLVRLDPHLLPMAE